MPQAQQVTMSNAKQILIALVKRFVQHRLSQALEDSAVQTDCAQKPEVATAKTESKHNSRSYSDIDARVINENLAQTRSSQPTEQQLENTLFSSRGYLRKSIET